MIRLTRATAQPVADDSPNETVLIFELTTGTIRRAMNRLTLLAVACLVCGAFLIWKGYQSGELFIGGGLQAMGAMGALMMLPTARRSDKSMTLDQPETNPIPVRSVKKKT